MHKAVDDLKKISTCILKNNSSLPLSANIIP